MSVIWYLDKGNAYLASGEFYIDLIDETALYTYGVVRDKKHGFNVVRVDFDPTIPLEEREPFLRTLLLAAEVRYHDLKGSQHGRPI